MSKKIKINELKTDTRNHNRHTKDGMALLEKSVDKVGIIESITVSNDNEIISGNARHEIIGRKFENEPIVIETDGTRPVILKRTDIESGTKEFYEASILANTTAKKNIDIDYEVIDVLEVELGIDTDSLGLDKQNFRMKNNPNYFSKELNEDSVCNDLFPITILQNIDEYNLFLEIKNKLNTQSSMVAFSEILKLVKNII